MKSKIELKRKFALIATSLLTLTSVALAEHGPGNGGNAVLMADGKYYLLDFVEAGIEKPSGLELFGIDRVANPGYGPPTVRPWTKRHLSAFPPDTQELILKQLERVEIANAHAAVVLGAVIRMYTWSFVNFPLKDVLVDDSVLSIPNAQIKQAAVRSGQTIRIQKQIWDGMDAYNQMGLVLHEVLYSLITPKIDSSGFLKQESWVARDLVAKIILAGIDGTKMQIALRSGDGALDFVLRNRNGPALPMYGSVDVLMGGYQFTWANRIEYTAGKNGVGTLYLGYWLGAEEEQRLENAKRNILQGCRYNQEERVKMLYIHNKSDSTRVRFKSYDRPEGLFYYLSVTDEERDLGPIGKPTQGSLEECQQIMLEQYQEQVRSTNGAFTASEW